MTKQTTKRKTVHRPDPRPSKPHGTAREVDRRRREAEGDPVRHVRKTPRPPRREAVIVDMEEAVESRPRVVETVPLDAPFLMLVIILTLFGLVMVFSASYAQAIKDFGYPSHYFVRQLMLGLAGVGGMLFFTFFDYYKLRRFSVLSIVVAVALLVAVLLFGRTVNNARRWIYILGTGFQPSELAKIAVILYFARYCEDHRATMGKIWTSLKPMLLILAPICLLLAKEPHYSAVILIAATAVIILYTGGLPHRWVVGAASVAGVGLAYLVFFGNSVPYIRDRFIAWQNPFAVAQGDGYQTIQSLYAIGSGGLFGVGLGNSRQKQLFLPEAHNDYIFSITCEELGFIGALIIIILFAALIWRGVLIAMHARDRFGALLVTGIMAQVSLQFLLNIAVVTNAIPVTGMSLPFFSYGGTSLALLLCEMGIVLNVSRQIRLTI